MPASASTVLEEAKMMRDQELEVVQSIYDGQLSVKPVSDNGDILLEMNMSIELDGQRQVNLIDAELGNLLAEPSHRNVSLHLSYLPPIYLTLLLPGKYPLEDRARIVAAHSAHSWLDQKRLRQALQQVLDDNPDGVIWPLFEYVRDGTVLSALHLDSPSTSRTLTLSHPTPHLLAPHLLAYNTLAANQSFSSTSYDCPICLTTVKGLRCVQIESCGHVACRDCLSQFWKLSIQTGEVDKVGCVNEECVKKAAKIDDPMRRGVGEDEVRNVVGELMLQRWQRLREKQMLERDPTVVRCPVETCQAPVPRPPMIGQDSENEDEWNRLRVCPSCSFSFCLACRRTWHGPIAPCKIVAVEQFLQSYMEAEPDSPERLRLERQYGKRQIQKMIAEHEESKANNAWLQDHTMACPGCRTNVEKTAGCNHMKCGRCSMHFCYRCGIKLNASNPYAHFSTRNTPCYGNLFDVDPDQTEWQPMEGFELL